ncbi:MAG: nitroreductase family protein [Candidatus Bathyarchaeia archaeon]
MEVFEAIRTRRSIRTYEDKPVEEDKLLRILEAARLAPSAGNRQPWKFIIITDPKVKEAIKTVKEKMRPPQARGSPRKGPLDTAPVVIVGCAIPGESFPGTDFWKIDVSIALQNLVLAAWEQGLGTCWIGVFHEEQELKKVLGIPEEARIVAMITVGYPAEKKEPVTDRKPLQQIISYNHW